MQSLAAQKTGHFIHRRGGKPQWIKIAPVPEPPANAGISHPQSGEKRNGDKVDNGFWGPKDLPGALDICMNGLPAPSRARGKQGERPAEFCGPPGYPPYMHRLSQDHPPGRGAQTPVVARLSGVIHNIHRPYYYDGSI